MCVCVCVCVLLGSLCLELLLRDVFESLKCWLDPWLSCMLDCIHVCLFLFLKNWFLATLKNSRHLAYLSSSKLFLIAISTPSRQLHVSIKKVLGSSIASRQLVDQLSFFNRVWWILPPPFDSCICRRFNSLHLARHLSWHLSTPLSIELYWPSI